MRYLLAVLFFLAGCTETAPPIEPDDGPPVLVRAHVQSQALGNDTAQYNFEASAQGFGGSSPITSVAVSTAQVYLGNQALVVNFNNPSTSGTGQVLVNPGFALPGATITYHVWLPSTMSGKISAIQCFAQQAASPWTWQATWQPASGLTFGGWNTCSTTLPATMGSLQSIGIEIDFSAATSGTFYIDSIGWPAASDGGTDAGSDGGADAGRDGGSDAGIDAGVDGGHGDGGSDAGNDAGSGGGAGGGAGGGSGGGDAGSDAGTDGGVACLKVMPLGDSITLGVNGGYRNGLWYYLTDAGYSLNYVGTLNDAFTVVPDKDHEGHSGYTIGGIAAELDGYLDAGKPDIVLLLIGTNDVAWFTNDLDMSQTAAAHNALVGQILAGRPNAWVIAGSIPPEQDVDGGVPPSGTARSTLVGLLNAQIKANIQARTLLGQRVRFADIYSTLQLSDLYDGIHPTQQASDKVAYEWFVQLQSVELAQPVCGGKPVCSP